jgi:2-dehydro-3-deoxygluconokinase
MKHVVTFGETMALMSSDRPGPLKHASSLSLGIGGSESNVAIALTRLGTPATWIGRIGQDPLGDLVETAISGEGVEVHALRDPHAPTGLMIKERRTSSTSRVWYYRRGSAGSRLRAGDVRSEQIRSAALLHISGISLALSDAMAGLVIESMETARSAGVPVSFDLNYRARLWSPKDAAAAYATAIRLADIVFAGEEEAEIALGASHAPAEGARRLCDLGPHEAVVTRGHRGAVAFINGELHVQDAIPVNAVDTVGAGDAFVAGYLSERLRGAGAAERLATGAAAGAYACLTAGDWEGLPTREELSGLLAAEPVTR